SESESHALERRKTSRGSLRFSDTGAAPLHRYGLVPAVPPASTDHGKRAIGVPQGLGRSCHLLSELPAGETGSTTPGPGGALVRPGAKERVDAGVPPNDGNEVRRDGRQGVVAP